MRPIDADALLKASRTGKVLYFDDTRTDGYTGVILAVDVERAPTIEAEPVRHGEWLYNDIYLPNCAECSECGWKSSASGDEITSYNYCPHCGAIMNGGDSS